MILGASSHKGTWIVLSPSDGDRMTKEQFYTLPFVTRILSITICGSPPRGSRSNRKSRAPHAALHDGDREKRWQVRRLGEVRRGPTCDYKPRRRDRAHEGAWSQSRRRRTDCDYSLGCRCARVKAQAQSGFVWEVPIAESWLRLNKESAA
jgi:hypothetical protein